MIKARVDQMQRSDRRMPRIRYVAVALAASTKAVGRPEMVSGRIEQRIAFTLEGGLTWGLPNEEACLLEPAPKVRLLRLALRMGKAGKRSDTVLNQCRMADKHHIRRSGPAVDQANVRDALEMMVEILPLSEGLISRRPMKVASHPRIDDVIHVVPLRGAH